MDMEGVNITILYHILLLNFKQELGNWKE